MNSPGGGGSAVLAALHVLEKIVGIESSLSWLERMRKHLNELHIGDKVELISVDIDEVGERVFPKGASKKSDLE